MELSFCFHICFFIFNTTHIISKKSKFSLEKTMNSFTNYTKTFFQTIFDIFWKKKVEFVFILLIPIYRYKICFWLGWLSQLNFRCLILAPIMISASWDLPTQGPQVQLPARCGVYFFHSLCLTPAPLVLSLFQINKILKKRDTCYSNQRYIAPLSL